MIVLLITYFVSGFITVGIGIPLIQRRIKPNGWYGFRTPKTLKYEDLWYDINAFTGRWLVWTGLATVAASIVLYPLDLGEDLYSIAVMAVLCVGMFYMLVQGLWMIHRYEVE